MKRTVESPGAGLPLVGRAALATILLVALLFQLAAAPPSPVGPAPERSVFAADEESGLALIVAAYDVLQDRFFRPLDSRVLLDAAWQGARRALGEQRSLQPGIAAPELVGDRQADLAQFSAQYRALLAAAGPGVNGARVAMAAAEEMTDSVGERHTVFLTPEQFTQFTASLTSDRGSVGLGIVIDGQRAPFTIASVVPGAPAAQAGVLEGDQIDAVDGRATDRLDLRGLSETLRGQAGQPVTLTLRRGDQVFDLTVIRARFVVPPLQTRALPEGVCHLRLTEFPVAYAIGPGGLPIGKELDAALEQCEQAGAQGWIMDLRGNGGGSAFPQVLGRFLDHGPVLVERDRLGGRYEQATDGHLFRVQRPLVVLIDGGSASASEAFASAVQEYGRGVVVGQRSAGVLSTASILPLPLGAGIEVAIQEVFTGRREVPIDGVGVTPDVVVGSDPDGSATLRRGIELALAPPPGVGPLPPPPAPTGAVLSEAELRGVIEPVLLRPEDAAEVGVDATIPGDLPLDTLNYSASGTPSLESEGRRALRLGWRGGLVQFVGGGFPPPYALQVYLYGDADGAHRDFREIYEPDEPRNPPQYRDVDPPIVLGDDTRATIGTGQNEGRPSILWRRGNVVYVVSQNVKPGDTPTFDGLVRLAQITDARAAQVGR